MYCHASAAWAQDIAYPKEKFPFCLAFRTRDQECSRENRDANWKCAQRPPLPLFFADACLTWDPQAARECEAKHGPGFYLFGASGTVDPISNAPTDSLVCERSVLKPEPETAPELSPEFARADEFMLPKEKFPQCLVVRIKTHECARMTEDEAWTCEARPTLRDPIAQCLNWAPSIRVTDDSSLLTSKYGGCIGEGDYPHVKFVTININRLTHKQEPIVRCEVGVGGPQLSETFTIHVPSIIYNFPWIGPQLGRVYAIAIVRTRLAVQRYQAIHNQEVIKLK
jgi:hypothetical protein